MDLTLNNLQGLICHIVKRNETKPIPFSLKVFFLCLKEYVVSTSLYKFMMFFSKDGFSIK